MEKNLKKKANAKSTVVTVATVVAPVKAVYDAKSGVYTQKQSLGIKLMISSNGLSAIVNGIYVPLTNNNGKAGFKSQLNKETRIRNRYDAESANVKIGIADAKAQKAMEYLQARYSITSKDYNLLVDLARAGIPLMTKKERLKNSAKA